MAKASLLESTGRSLTPKPASEKDQFLQLRRVVEKKSPGVFTDAGVFVCYDAISLDDGDILVCETTDPSWVSLFLVAGGVVTDHGGLLSHGPIVARELGIPCVCGTGDGSHRIQDGQRLRLDGDAGKVEVIG